MAKLTPEQVAAVFKRLHSTTGYLVRMRERMQQLGFIHTDRLFQLVRDAEFAMRELVHGVALCELRGRSGPTAGPKRLTMTRPPGYPGFAQHTF
jgi:hypothetical protein